MAKNGIVTNYDDAGFPGSAAFTVSYAYTAMPVAAKTTAGRLLKVLVTTTTAGGAITIYDNATTNSGVILAVIPSGATAGTLYDLNLPAFNGIYVYTSAASAGVLTIGYS